MATGAAERFMLDTNVLLAATDEGRAEHQQALMVINEWPDRGATLYASGQILREYIAVATRPLEQNGLGLSQADATANVRALRGRTRLLDESDKVSDRLLQLIENTGCGGKQVHDANVVATMLVHGVDTVLTMNTEDFARFDQYVTTLDLTP